MAKVSTATGPIDIRQHIASKESRLHDPLRAKYAENMPRGTSVPHALSTAGAHCGRDRTRALGADTRDPHIDRKPVPPST